MFFECEAQVQRWEARREDGWFLAQVPRYISDMIREVPHPHRGFGSRRVEVVVGDTCWRTSIFPDSESGGFVLPLKKSVREAEGIDDSVATIVLQLRLLDV